MGKRQDLEILEQFFNSLYSQRKFVSAVPDLAKRNGWMYNDDYCIFPDLHDPDPEAHFDGVKIGLGSDELIVSDAVFFEFFNEACRRFLEKHPEFNSEIAPYVNRSIGD